MHAKLFILYLIAVYGIAIVCSIRLGWFLISIGQRKRISVRSIVDGEVGAEVLVRAALSDQILIELSNRVDATPTEALSSTREKVALRTLRAADSSFLYLFGIRQTEVAIINRLAALTFIVSFLVITYGAFSTWAGEFNNRNITGYEALLITAALLLARLALGLSTCTILYGISSIFNVMLMRRVNKWKYLYSQVDLHWPQ
jgi:hypothetical protein